MYYLLPPILHLTPQDRNSLSRFWIPSASKKAWHIVDAQETFATGRKWAQTSWRPSPAFWREALLFRKEMRRAHRLDTCPVSPKLGLENNPLPSGPSLSSLGCEDPQDITERHQVDSWTQWGRRGAEGRPSGPGPGSRTQCPHLPRSKALLISSCTGMTRYHSTTTTEKSYWLKI